MNPNHYEGKFLMNMPANPFAFNPIAMSSREIADLCEKEHKHVIRDIEKMLVDVFGDGPDLGHQGVSKAYDARGYISEIHLPKDLTVTLITGYRADLRYKVVKRLEEMEAQIRAQAAAPVLDLNDPAQLVPLLTSYAQRTQIAEAKVAEQQPKVEAFDRIEASDGCLGVRQASKVLAYPERKLTKWLETHGWAFRQSGKGPLQAYVAKRQQGYMEHRLDAYKDPETQEPRTRIQLVITPKGVARLAQVLPSEGRA